MFSFLKKYGAVAAVLAAVIWIYPAQTYSQEQAQCCNLVNEALRAHDALHVGDTRAKLEKYFEVSGGMSTIDQATFVYRKCPFIQMDVTFHGDKIASLSRLYVDWENLN